MKKVNLFFIGLVLILLTGGINAQAQSSTDFYVGDWDIVLMGMPNGDAEMVLHLERADGKLKGSIKSELGELELDSVEEKDNSITLFFTLESYDLNMFFEKVDDNNIKGNMVDQFDVTGKRVVK